MKIGGMMGDEIIRPRLAALLEHFSEIGDGRDRWRGAYPLKEVLLLVTCATICACDDFEDIAEWGESHLEFLREFSEFYYGIPCARWLRDLLNRVDPVLFAKCLEDWIATLWPGKPDVIAIDGKTARRTHDRGKGRKALHTLSAYATNARLVLTQTSVPEKANEITAIPEVLDQLAEAGQLKGSLVTIDAMGCQHEIADKIVDLGADYILTVKGNQPTLEADIISYFDTAPADECVSQRTVEKSHGRIETRTYIASQTVDWLTSPGKDAARPKFASVKTIIRVVSEVESKGNVSVENRHYISSATRPIEKLAEAVRGHWTVENQVHWVLDVEFKDDLARYRVPHGAKNMAAIRRFALNLVRNHPDKKSIKIKRKRAGWNTDFLLEILQL
jgi:predicted transposase YbfD/YdcC